MNNFKKTFSIKDLENLSGIKAHTIRIWEKRYGLLKPDRTDTNIRYYNLEMLQKLLNVALLYRNGLKISKIAALPEESIPDKVRKLAAASTAKTEAVNAIKLAMVNFDPHLFQATYNSLAENRTFTQIFQDVFLPFLTELGLLWQSSSVGPAQEHFISHLVKEKIFIATDKLPRLTPGPNDDVYVLFLPENEIHEIGLLFINYTLSLHGKKTIYLGPAMPLEFLTELTYRFKKLTFISYFTIAPTPDKLRSYIDEFNEIMEMHQSPELWILGQQSRHLLQENLPAHIRIFDSIKRLTTEIT